MSKTVLITGANRGLGLEFCRQYAVSGWRVIAACRSPSLAFDLLTLAQQYRNLQIDSLDVANFASVDKFALQYADEKIDILINNAGIYGDLQGKGFGNIDYNNWSSTLTINTMAPLKMVEAFLPQLLRGENKLIATVSSLMGSMSDNASGGSYLYRSSKAGLNAVMKSLSVDLLPRSIGVLILHPGWVRTDMGGKNALIDVEESVSGMRKIIDAFSLSQTGQFIKYDGSIAPW
jgi:NAD(P)-dependent dehydrogenase (short-subunit alcohol dehydrogenase family)